jgi:hypothetical protein
VVVYVTDEDVVGWVALPMAWQESTKEMGIADAVRHAVVVAIGIRGRLVPMVTEMTMLAQRDRMEGKASWWVTRERSAQRTFL